MITDVFSSALRWLNEKSELWMAEAHYGQKQRMTYPDTPDELMVRINHAMIRKKHYKDPDITIDKLCGIYKVNRSYLSRAIQAVYGIHFCAWVNIFRIEEAKRLIQEKKTGPLDMYDLAYQCGFNSIRSLTRVFSANVHCTPMQYYKRMRAK